MEKVISTIGGKIRKLRQEEKLSIQKLAEKSGVSPAGVYKIETNEMTPSITTLMKIASALGKKVSYFVEEQERVKNIEYTCKRDRKTVYNKESRILIESFAARLEDGKIYVGLLSVRPGGGTGTDIVAHSGEELFYCMEGTVEFLINEETYVLRKGDSVHFKSELPHSWKNLGNRDAKILYVLSPLALAPEITVVR
jgi:transcriptional regulator with XRE-family HTH domain